MKNKKEASSNKECDVVTERGVGLLTALLDAGNHGGRDGAELGLAWLPGSEQAADPGFPAQGHGEPPRLGQRCLCAVLPLVPISWLSWLRRFQPSPHSLAVGCLLPESLPEHCEPMGAAPPAKPLPIQWLSPWVTHTAGQRQRLTCPYRRPWPEPHSE